MEHRCPRSAPRRLTGLERFRRRWLLGRFIACAPSPGAWRGASLPVASSDPRLHPALALLMSSLIGSVRQLDDDAGSTSQEYSAHVVKRARTPIDQATRKKKTRGIGRPTNKGSIGKEVLIEKTAQLLRTLPPEKLSLTAAAQAANVHLTLFKYYFQDRTHLLTDVARHLTLKLGQKVAAAEDDRPPPPERLRIRIDAMVDFYFEHPFYHRLMVEIMAETEDPLAADLINAWMSNTLAIYRGIMADGVEQGSLRALDVSLTYLAIMGLCEQFHYSLRLFPDRTAENTAVAPSARSADAAKRYKGFLYDFVFNGLGTRPTDARMGAPTIVPEDT